MTYDLLPKWPTVAAMGGCAPTFQLGSEAPQALRQHKNAQIKYAPENIGLKIRMSREKKFLNRIPETNWATVPNRAGSA
jgi:hypothetical protein